MKIQIKHIKPQQVRPYKRENDNTQLGDKKQGKTPTTEEIRRPYIFVYLYMAINLKIYGKLIYYRPLF